MHEAVFLWRESRRQRDADRLLKMCWHIVAHAVRCAPRFNTELEVDDVKCIAEMCVFRAADKFDPNMGCKFESYLTGMMEDTLRNNCRDARYGQLISKDGKDYQRKILRTVQDLSNSLQREPTDLEVSKAVGVSQNVVHSVRNVVTMNAVSQLSENDRVIGYEGAELGKDDYGSLNPDLVVDKMMLSDGLSFLDAEDNAPRGDILRLYYFHDLNMREISETLNIPHKSIPFLLRSGEKRMKWYLLEKMGGNEYAS